MRSESEAFRTMYRELDEIRAAVEALVTALVDAARAPQPEPAAEYLTTAAAATVASVGEATIRRWVREGRIRGYRAGRVLRVRRDDLDRLLATGRRSTVSNDESPEELALRAVSGPRFRR